MNRFCTNQGVVDSVANIAHIAGDTSEEITDELLLNGIFEIVQARRGLRNCLAEATVVTVCHVH